MCSGINTGVKNLTKNRLGVFKVRLNLKLMNQFQSFCPRESAENIEQELFWNTKNKNFIKNKINSLSLQSFRDLPNRRDGLRENITKSRSAEIIKNPINKTFKHSESVDFPSGIMITNSRIIDPPLKVTKVDKFEAKPINRAKGEHGKKINRNSLDMECISINEKELMASFLKRKAEKEKILGAKEEKGKTSGDSSFLGISSDLEEETQKNSVIKFREFLPKSDLITCSQNNKKKKMEDLEKHTYNLIENQLSDFEIKKVESFCATNMKCSSVKNLNPKQKSRRQIFYHKEEDGNGPILRSTKYLSPLKEQDLNKRLKYNQLFDYGFETVGSSKMYFLEGNCKNILQKINQRTKLLSTRKLGMRSPLVSGGLRPKLRNNFGFK